jgi:hypothetical protein
LSNIKSNIKTVAFWLAVSAVGLFCAELLNLLIWYGPLLPRGYTRAEYDATALCALIQPGMERARVLSLIESLGKPHDIAYLKTEAAELASLKKSLASRGQSNVRLLPSDTGDTLGPNTLPYLNNVFVIGGSDSFCHIQMDAKGRKVVNASTSGGPMPE